MAGPSPLFAEPPGPSSAPAALIEVRAPALAFVDPTEPEDRPLARLPDMPGLPAIHLPDPLPLVERPATPAERARAVVQEDRKKAPPLFRRMTGGAAASALEDGGEGSLL